MNKLYLHVNFGLQCEKNSRNKAHHIRLVFDMTKDNADGPRCRLEAPLLVAATSIQDRDAVEKTLTKIDIRLLPPYHL